MIRSQAFCFLTALGAAFCVFAAGPGEAADPASAAKYNTCLAMVPDSPEQALVYAQRWGLEEGGGSAAKHCEALANLRKGNEVMAAVQMEDMADAPDMGGKKERAEILNQAGNVRLMAKQPETAEMDFTAAIDLDPDNPNNYFDRAHAKYRQGQWAEVIADTTRAIQLDRNYADAYVLRGTAKRASGDLLGAASDIEFALRIDPQNVGAALEMAELKQMGVAAN